ncbi:MFS multidrug transporter-like protein [Patellaria atrata CBS 101060]|uniref:MFS multidrug transporter-like protein n=1 Tax=Patellaria atrata CBS 101060 TaxID=1346257 RepID=A0A9P4SDB4_9PEZI|nr:MFS multidrug transporter-like protein [Patellaria atrata CBS 101060]
MAEPLTRSTSTSHTSLISLEKEQTKQNHHIISSPPSLKDPEKASPTPQDPPQPTPSQRPYTPLHWFLVLLAVYASAFLYGLDNTIVADVQAAVLETYASVEKLGWLGIGFPLGSIATILSLGKAFSMFDIKALFVGSVVMFSAGSALCGGAPTMEALIVGRVWAGAGGAGMYLGALNIISYNTTEFERALYVGILGLTWGVGCILGPVIGGSFADSSATWRWAFYINLIIFGVIGPIMVFLIKPLNPRPDLPTGQKLKHMDWVGVVLNAALYACFVLVFTFGGAQWTWDDHRTIITFVFFGVTIILFSIQQYLPLFTTISDRLFPGDFLKSRSMVLLYIVTSAANGGLFIPIYYIPLYFQFVHNDSAIDAAVRLLPFICLNITGTMANGLLMPRYGYYAPWYLLSSIFILVGGSLMYVSDAATSNGAIYGYTILIGFGTGIVQQAAYSIAPAKVGMQRIGDAIGFINQAQIGSIVIGLTITSTVFQNIGYKHLSSALAGQGFSGEEIHAALAGAKSAIFEGASEETKARAVDAIVKAIADGYILVIAAGALMMVCSLLLKKEKLFMAAAAGA